MPNLAVRRTGSRCSLRPVTAGVLRTLTNRHGVTEGTSRKFFVGQSKIALDERARVSGAEGAASPPPEEEMKESKYPVGWDEERVRRVFEHYETQSDEEAVAEDEAACEATTHTMMEVPVDLVPLVRELIAKRSAE